MLSLPKKVSKGSDNTEYIYDAAGNKLAKKVNGKFINFYCGSIVYDGDKEIDYIIHPEGLVQHKIASGKLLAYQYNITDHLGNVRAVTDESNWSIQQNIYYPFGLVHNTSSLDKNKYLYNGKEIQNDVIGGIEYRVLDYHARSYDPYKGRFDRIDPLAEKSRRWGTYVYCINNPLRFIDPDGRRVDDYFNKRGTYLGSDNANTDFIRIVDENKLTNYVANNPSPMTAGVEVAVGLSTGTLDNTVGQQVSTPIENTNLSPDAITNIVTHYDNQLTNTGVNLETAKLETKSMEKSVVMKAVKGSTQGVLGIKFGGRESIKINRIDGKVQPLLNTGSNVTNTLVHERTHIPDNRTGMSTKQKEIRAINAQKQHPSYKKTTQEYQQNINNYEQDISKLRH